MAPSARYHFHPSNQNPELAGSIPVTDQGVRGNQQDVDQPISHFARGGERTRVVTVTEHVALSVDDVVERSRETYWKSRHPARKGHFVGRFDDQMYVVGLHRELHHTKPLSPRPCNSAAKRNEDCLLAQAGQAPIRAQGHVSGVPLVMGRTHAVRDIAASRLRLPTGIATGPAPRWKAQLQLAWALGRARARENLHRGNARIHLIELIIHNYMILATIHPTSSNNNRRTTGYVADLPP